MRMTEEEFIGKNYQGIYQQTNCESQSLLIIWTKRHDLKNKMRSEQAGTVCILLVAYHFTVSIERHTDRVL